MSAAASAEGPDSSHPDEHIEYVVARGLRVRVSVRGDGPPLLMLNGIGCNIEMWEPLRSSLVGLQTIAFDAPGTGESDTPSTPLRMRHLARLVIRILDQLGYNQVDVLGFSFGGMLGQQLTRDFPSRVRRLVLCATTCGVGGLLGKPQAMKVLMTSRRYRDPEYMRQVAPIVYGGRAATAPDASFMQSQYEARVARPPSRAGYASQLSTTFGWSSTRWLYRLRQPTLVLAGDADPVTPAGNARIIAASVPNSKLHILPGGGHLFPLDSAADIAPMILDWLNED